MESTLNKYFADELEPDEKGDFLFKVYKEEELREEFIENQLLVTLIDWSIPKNDGKLAQLKLSEFMRRMKNVEK